MKKPFWIYGIVTAVLLVFLETIHYKRLLRDISTELFGLAIGVVFLGLGLWIGFLIFQRQQRSMINRSKAKNLDLSQRELEVLQLLDQGLSNQEIADKLFVSINTIKTHLAKIYQKLGVARRTQAIQKSRDLKIITEEELTNHPKG